MEGTWEAYQKNLFFNEGLGLSLDMSRMNFPPHYEKLMEPGLQRAWQEMAALEAGGEANPDENRMVGHYWLRTPQLAPSPQMRQNIVESQNKMTEFVAKIHQGDILSATGKRFTRFLLIGIGGSALGPQLLCDALLPGQEKLKPYFMDNTDPDGLDRILKALGPLEETLVLVTSKSGKTPETRNGMLEVKRVWDQAGLSFGKQAVAITSPGSSLDLRAEEENWLASFPIWDWVGGRTSVTSSVGLLPAALQGIDIEAFLAGARDCDALTRQASARDNPAALMAMAWFWATGGEAKKDLVVLPYKDGLQFFAKYLQQLIMESLGKGKDVAGQTVEQGLSVYGNKGSTDQHAYVQQLIEGVNNFFVTFVEVLENQRQELVFVEEGVTSADYLRAFLQGTREALTKQGRISMTLTIKRLDARSLGALIALYERTVGLYASLVNINAYHQPGVEAGKKSAHDILQLQRAVLNVLGQKKGQALSVADVAQELGGHQEEAIYKILEYMSVNDQRGVQKIPGRSLFEARYSFQG